MSPQGFPRTLRLLSAGDFRYVFAQADLKIHAKGMLVLARFNRCGHARIGLVAGKKNVKLAVERNRFKRLARESFRLRQEKLPTVDVVLLARRGVDDMDNAMLQRQLHGLWKRLQRDALRHGNTTAPAKT
ncbi:ribonuclease P protein component [Halomonas garicola]|uniref:ribonuclease P protein component n=1 Tax=Halomonas garicola TaxID=1690008 RepID=UPI00289BE86C|nr:ribonuclease P protein component [Halomonas garicola]